MPEVEKAQNTRRRIGLLGGSFNPAHEGHLHISKLALEKLGLDEVWWLVSPQNPLKPKDGMASFKARMASANAVTKAFAARIVVTDIEARLGTRYTCDTLKRLHDEHPDVAFVWLIGADNLRQMPKWKGWRAIFRTVPIAVFPRAPYSLRALGGRAARRFANARVAQSRAKSLADLRPPAWIFLRTPMHGAAATRIRRLHGNEDNAGSLFSGDV